MAGFITAEGLVIPIGSDVYDYVNDQRRLASSIRSVVPVTNQAAGDVVAAAMATDGRSVSDTNPLVVWNAATKSLNVKGTSGWSNLNLIAPTFGANISSWVSSGTGVGTNMMAGLNDLLIQGGTYVGATDSSGNIAVPYSAAFPNGVVTAVAWNGDAGTGNLLMHGAGSPFTQNLSTLFVNVKTANTGANIASSTVRINWIALGW